MWKIKAYVDAVHEERAGQKFKEIKGYGWFSFSSCFSFFFPNSYDCLWTISANDAGSFNNEMAPIEVKTKKGKQTVQVDEHPHPQTTLEKLNKLPPVFKKEGTVTAGNSSVGSIMEYLELFLMCAMQNNHVVSFRYFLL